MTDQQESLAQLKRLCEVEYDRFMVARWNSKGSVDYRDVFPEELYRARLNAMDRAYRELVARAELLGSREELVEAFFGVIRKLIGETPENVYFISDLRLRLKVPMLLARRAAT